MPHHMQKPRAKIPENFSLFVEKLLADVGPVEGYLSPNEMRFLALLGSCPTAHGDVLEIGSFKGKSTIILAKSAALAGDGMIHAVDPLTSPSETDPDLPDGESALADFRSNIERHGVAERITLHQMLSSQLAPSWDKKLRLLWIDGDHTYAGTRIDIESFAPHVADKGIVAIHDVLHEFEGGIRIFMENILLSPHFGACGFCGSIAWAQFRSDAEPSEEQLRHKLWLYKKLSKLVPFIAFGRALNGLRKKQYKLYRSRIPRGAVDPAKWAASLD